MKVVVRIETTSSSVYDKLKKFLAEIDGAKDTDVFMMETGSKDETKKQTSKGKKILSQSFPHFPIGNTGKLEAVLLECKSQDNKEVAVIKIMNELCEDIEIQGTGIPKNWKSDLRKVISNFAVETSYDEPPSFYRSCMYLNYSNKQFSFLKSALQYVLDAYVKKIDEDFHGTVMMEDFIWSLRRFVNEL